MMYIIFNHDGSIKEKNFNEFIQQGNNVANKIVVAIEGVDPDTYVLAAHFTLPNDSKVNISSNENYTLNFNDGTYPGKVIEITSEVTSLPGIVRMNIQALAERSGKDYVLTTYSVYLTINDGVDPGAIALMSQEEFNHLLLLLNSKLSIHTKSVKVDALPEYGEPETIYYVKTTYSSYIYDVYYWNVSNYAYLGTTAYGLYTDQDGNEFEEELNGKFDSFAFITNAKIDELIAKINAAASGSPKGSYATISALTNDDPDHDYIYVVRANLHWYYWDGTQWADGGAYTTAVPDDALDNESTNGVENRAICKGILAHSYLNLVKFSTNVFNKDNCVDGYYENGNIISGNYKHYYIPVKENDVILSNVNLRKIAQVDEFKQYQSMVATENTTTGTATMNGFLVVSVANTNIESCMIVINQTLPLTYIPFKLEYDGLKDQDGNSLLANKSVGVEKLIEFDKTANLFNYSTVSKNTYNNNGNPEPSQYYDSSDFIPVVSGQLYTLSSNVRNIIGFNSNKEFLQQVSTNPIDHFTPNFNGYVILNLYHSVPSAFMMVKGSELPEQFVEYGYHLKGLLSNQDSMNDKKLKVSLDNNDIIIESYLNDGSFYSETMYKTSGINDLFNLHALANESGTIKDEHDDICPFRLLNTTIGANHGYIQSWQLDNTDKTSADIGSQWTDGTNTYTIVDINSSNKIVLIGETEPYTWDNSVLQPKGVAPTGSTLTHVSGATHTSDITIASLTQVQLSHSVNNRKFSIFCNGIDVTNINGSFKTDELLIRESYNIIDYKAMADFLHDNIGGSYYDDNIEGCAKVETLYKFIGNGKCLVNTTLTALKNIRYSANNGIVQAAPMLPYFTGAKRKFYIGDVNEIGSLDFSNLVDASDITGTILFTKSDLLNAEIPVSKMVSILTKANDERDYGFAVGYIIDKSAGSNENRLVRCDTQSGFAEIRADTYKMYPNCYAKFTSSSAIMPKGKVLTTLAYRVLFGKENIDALCAFNIENNNECYVYLAYNQSVENELYSLKGYEGCEIEILQSTGSFTLDSDIVGAEGISFTINTSGTAILKIKK